MLVGALVDSWDRMREGAMEVLLQFPAPLPGLGTAAAVERLITWGCQLLESPRCAPCSANQAHLVHRLPLCLPPSLRYTY